MSTEQPASINYLPKRLVLCLDGTWGSVFDEKKRSSHGDKILKPTNVLKTSRAVLPRDPKTGKVQLIYYDTGLGALSLHPGTSNKALRLADRILGGAWGAGFEANVEEALTHLVNNHEIGDEVYLFGFSRGAATAQALTGFLDWLNGLPVKNDAYFLPILFRAYIASKGRRPSKEVVADINKKLANKKRSPLNQFKKG